MDRDACALCDGSLAVDVSNAMFAWRQHQLSGRRAFAYVALRSLQEILPDPPPPPPARR